MADTNSIFETSTTGARAKIYSSDPLASVDAPEVQMGQAKFVYNYFVTSERTEYTGGTGFITNSFAASGGSPTLEQRPRSVEISYKRPVAEFLAGTTSEISAYLDGNTLIELAEKGYVHIEDSITSPKFQRIQVTGAGIDLRLVSGISGSSEYISPDEGTVRSSNPELSSKIAKSIAGYRGTLPSDLASSIAASDSDKEISSAIVKYINLSGQPTQRIGYYDNETRGQTESKADLITSRQETLGINLLMLDSVIRASVANTNHLLNPEVAEYLATSATDQQSARADSAAAGISSASYEISITPFYTSETTTTSYRSVLVGYIIEKIEVKEEEIIEYPAIVVSGANLNPVKDIHVNYGSMYKYRVRAVFMRESAAIFSESGRSGTARFLVAGSGESAEFFVPCIEDVPPPPPADLRATYDYEKGAVRLTWSLPVNSQRDIKYFQIFRRQDVDSPFRLLHVIDFDDSGIKDVPRETYPSSIVSQVDIVQCYYFDVVPPEKEFIYAVCCVDAHTLSSGYSIQLGTIFSRSRNALMTRVISRSESPKTYPNMYINEDAFSDVVRVSGSKKIVTFLDPELLTVVHPNGTTENLVEDMTFTISLINEDSCLTDKVVLTTSKYVSSPYVSASILTDASSAITLDPTESISHDFFSTY